MAERQFVCATSATEEKILTRIAKCKDELVRRAPGFVDAAQAARGKMRPHPSKPELELGLLVIRESRPDVYEALEHNACLAQSFANKWTLPYYAGMWNFDPRYLFEAPFSGAPLIEGTGAAVYERSGIAPPILHLQVDVRFPIPSILKILRERLERGQSEWEAAGNRRWPKIRDEAAALERMLNVDRLTREKKTNREIAQALEISADHIPALRRKMRQMIEGDSYRDIAPYMLPEWQDPRQRSYVGVEVFGAESVGLRNRRLREERTKRLTASKRVKGQGG